MANTNRVEVGELDKAISQTLTLYHKNVNDQINRASENAVKELVKQTKKTAPVGARGSFKKSIASKMVENRLGRVVYAWYAKSPDHRLTHLLVHGHATRNGGRTKGDPFLHNAVANVIPEWEKAVEEAIKNG